MRFASLLSATMLLATVACEDRNRDLPTMPTRVAPNQISAYMAVSNSNPAVGTDLTVWVRARRGSAIAPIGSFTLRVSYDSTRLHFRDAARSAQGMVMANGAKAGIVFGNCAFVGMPGRLRADPAADGNDTAPRWTDRRVSPIRTSFSTLGENVC